MEKSLDPSKVLGLELFDENEEENDQVFSFSTINKYKTDAKNLKDSIMKLGTSNAPLKFKSEGNFIIPTN